MAKPPAALIRQTGIPARNLPDQATPLNNQGPDQPQDLTQVLAQDLVQDPVPDQTPDQVKLAREWAAAQAKELRARDRQVAALEDDFR